MNASLQCSSSNAQSFSTHAKKKLSTASSKKRKSHLEPSVPLRAQNEQESNPKRRRPQPSRTRANFTLQRKLLLPEKNTMFRATPNISNIQIASMIHENEACVRGFLRIPRVEAMKTQRSCELDLIKDFLRHMPTGLKDLLRHVPAGLKDLSRHVPAGLQDLLKLDLKIS